LVDRQPDLRSPEWLAGVVSECDTTRLFVVERRQKETHALLLDHGHRLLAETSRLQLYGGCVSSPRASQLEVGGPRRSGAPT
jgi:hypothetical protein